MKTHEKFSILYPAHANRKTPILIHDNARPHKGQIVLKNLSDLDYDLSQPSFLPDLELTYFHLFSHLERFLDNKIFNDEVEAKNSINDF